MHLRVFTNNVVELFLEFLSDREISDDLIPSNKWHEMMDKIMTVASRFGNIAKTESVELVIDAFEELLLDCGVEIPNSDRDADDENVALIYGEDYYNLEDAILEFATESLI